MRETGRREKRGRCRGRREMERSEKRGRGETVRVEGRGVREENEMRKTEE